MNNNQPDHCIIGAGFTGLPIVKKFLELGQTFEILERNDGVGGIWRKGVYENARLISSKRSTQFPGFPMPENYPVFPGRDQVQSYLESYANHYDLKNHIVFNCEITSIKPTYAHKRQTGWQLTDQFGNDRSYKTITIATGHFWKPRPFNLSNEFKGEIISSKDYDSPDVFTGKKVLIVGHANTGADIAVDAMKHCCSVDISCRSGANFLPREFFGIPTSDFLYFSPLKFDPIDRIIAKIYKSLFRRELKILWYPHNNKINLNQAPRCELRIHQTYKNAEY